MNKFLCKGFLGQDPELRHFPDGTAVVNFSVADTQKWKDKQSGEIKEKTEWMRFVATGKRAEVIAKHFSKGSEILITDSQLRNGSYEKDGQTIYTTEFFVNGFEFCGRKSDAGAARTNQQSENYAPQNNPPQQSDDFDDDIPF